jgi:hypothetical protein
MSLAVRPYSENDAVAWDAFCNESLQGTLLHTRCFLSYHGKRFVDSSLIIEVDGKCVGLFPAALSPSDTAVVVSHPGVTYGGVIHHGILRGDRMIEALSVIKLYYSSRGLVKLLYKAVPAIYHQAPAQDDLYALFRLAAKRIRCDLSSTIDLQHRLPVSERRRRSLKKAVKAGVEIVEGSQYLSALWDVLFDNLERKHGLLPVHNLEEIKLLAERFPENIRCVCGEVNGKIEAGTILFITSTTYHAQYIASSETGYDVSALDAVFDYCIQAAQQNKKRWFDFGISTEDSGLILNDGLYRYKSEFGAGGTMHEFYEMDLQEEKCP